MKEGVISWLTFTLSLLAMTAMMTGVYSQNSVTILPGPVKVTQGKSVRLWCKVKHHTYGVPVHWQSPPKFRTRTGDCKTYEKQKFEMSCAPFKWYNLTIKDVEWKDRGKYRCIHGKSMELVDLQVLVPVTNVSLTHDLRNTTKPLKKDMKAVFTCSTNCASPTPNITWFENGQPFNDSLRVNQTELGCTGDEEGLERTISMVTVTGKKVVKKKKNSTILCVAKNAVTEQGVSLAINITYDELLKPPQPAKAIVGIVAASVGLVLVVVPIALLVRNIVNVRKFRKTMKDLRRDAEERMELLHIERSTTVIKPTSGCSIIYEYDDTYATHEEGIAFLGALLKDLRKHISKVELREVKRCDMSDDRTESKILEVGQGSRSKKVILSFPEDEFCEDQLEKSFNKAILQGGELSFVAVIIQAEEFAPGLQWIEKRWNEKKRQTQWFGSAKCHLQFLQDTTDETTKLVDVALMNLGTGLAWSFYLGYLIHLLQVFASTLPNSEWQDKNSNIPRNRIAKQIYIVFTTNCQQPKIMNSDRIKLKDKIKHHTFRAGLKRDYFLAVQEVKSKDGSESYYGVVCFLTAVQCLLEMKDDPNKEFVRFDENDMRTHGKDCLEKLKLAIRYNEVIKKDESKFDFIEFNTETANADENDLADDLFSRMKMTCSLTLRRTISTQEARSTDANQTGVLFDDISTDIKKFADNLTNSKMITDCPRLQDRIEFGLEIIKESKKIFMILTDDFVKSDAFAKWFYVILDRGFQINDKRFLVCLNCLTENADHPKVLELEQLFCCVGYIRGWANKVKRELEGAVEEIKPEQLLHNIGTGLAMSWYYNFLKIKIPKVRDVIDKCPILKKKFKEGRMPHKVFFLLPSSCYCPEKVPCVDIVDEVHGKDINLPHIKKDNRDYTPRVYSLKDDGNEYYAFVEYIAPADIMYRMRHCTDTMHPKKQSKVLRGELNRFQTKLLKLIILKDEPMDIINRIDLIQYNDEADDWKDEDLERLLLAFVKQHIPRKKERVLPRHIDNGATVEVHEHKETKPAPEAPAAMHKDTNAGGGAEPDGIANTTRVEQ